MEYAFTRYTILLQLYAFNLKGVKAQYINLTAN